VGGRGRLLPHLGYIHRLRVAEALRRYCKSPLQSLGSDWLVITLLIHWLHGLWGMSSILIYQSMVLCQSTTHDSTVNQQRKDCTVTKLMH
jgi:hypothetical protein